MTNIFPGTSNIEKLCNKISQRLGVLNRCRKFITKDTALLLYNALTQPLFDYADIVWQTCKKEHIVRLERLQKLGARIILQCGVQDLSSTDLLNRLKWLPISKRLELHTVTMVYKCLNDLAPQYLSDLFTQTDQVHNYNTRHSDSFILT